MPMVKKLLIGILIFLCLISSAYATTGTRYGLVLSYNGTSNGSIGAVDSVGTYTGSGGDSSIFSATGKIESGFAFLNNNWLVTPDIDKYKQLNLSKLNNFTVAFWINVSAYASDDASFGTIFGACGASNMLMYSENGAERLYFEPAGATTPNMALTEVGKWIHMVIVVNRAGDKQYFYKNGVQFNNGTVQSSTYVPIGSGCKMIFGSGALADRRMNGYMDEIHFWNRSLTVTEIKEVYGNESVGISYPWGADYIPTANLTIQVKNNATESLIGTFYANITNGTNTWNYYTTGGQINTSIPETQGLVTISLGTIGYYSPRVYTNYNVSTNLIGTLFPYLMVNLSEYPNNNTQYNYSINFNFNVTARYDGEPTGTWCNLTYDGAQIYAQEFLNMNGTLNANYSATLGLTGGYHTYYWECNNDFVGFIFDEKGFWIDETFPTITTDFSKGKVFINTNISANIKFEDDQALYSYNISINGNSVIYNNTLEGATLVTYNFSNASIPGARNITIVVYDGHTANKLTDSYDISTGIFGDVLEVNSNNKKIKIQAKDKSLSDKWSTNKLIDRYTFKYIPDIKKTTQIFIINTDEDINIIEKPDLPYKKWLVIGNKWVDFRVKGQKDFTIDIKKNNKKQVEVTIGNLKNTDVIEFESIGELNRKEASYIVYKATAAMTSPSIVTETELQSDSLYIVKNSTSVTTSALFYWNLTSYIPTETITTNTVVYNTTFNTPLYGVATIPLTWNLTLTSDVGTGNALITQNQEIYAIQISNCSGTGMNKVSVNFTLYSEETANKLIGNITGTVNIWSGEKSSGYRSFNLSWYQTNNFAICIFENATIDYNGDYSFEPISAGYAARKFSDFNASIPRTMRYEDLYLILDTASDAVIHLVNQLGQDVPGYLIQMLKYNYGTATYSLVEGEITDINGNTKVYYSDTSEYKWIVKTYSGTKILETGRGYITADPTTLRILEGGYDILTPTNAAWNLATLLYNTSDIIYLNWTTLAGTSGTICLNVTHVNGTKSNTLYGACSSVPYGSLSYNFSATKEGTIQAVAWIKGSTYVTNILQLLLYNSVPLWQDMGTSAMVVYMIFIMIAVGITITRISAMPMALGAVHILCWWLGIIPGTWGFAVVVLCAAIVIMSRVSD